MSKTILITGATGFLGSHLVKAFLKQGYSVSILKRSFSNTWRIDSVISNVISFDLDDFSLQDVFVILGKVDAVIHTATCYGRKNESYTEIFEANVSFPLKLLETSVFFGTEVFLNTDTVLPSHLNTYSLSKKHFLDWGKQFAEKKVIRFVNLKLEHIFGAYDDDSKFVTYIIKNCINNMDELNLTQGEQKRDFIHVDEVTAIYQLLFQIQKIVEKQDFFQEYSIGSGKAITVRQLVEMIHRLTQSKTVLKFGALPYREGEVMFSEAKLDALNQIGYVSTSSLEKALKQTIFQYRDKYCQ